MNSFAFGKHSRKFPNCLSPLYVWKVSFKSTWTFVAYFQMVATVHPCLPRVPHFARSEHGNVSWWKLVRGFVRTWQRWDFCYFDSQPKISSFFRLRIFPCWVGRGEIPDLNQTCLGGFDLWQDFWLVLKLFQSRKEDWRWSLKYKPKIYQVKGDCGTDFYLAQSCPWPSALRCTLRLISVPFSSKVLDLKTGRNVLLNSLVLLLVSTYMWYLQRIRYFSYLCFGLSSE